MNRNLSFVTGKKYLLVLISLFIFQAVKLSAQLAYNEVSPGQRVSIFSETFDNNTNEWLTDNSWVSGIFKNGYYYIACKNFKQNTGLTYKTISIDQTKDFELETSFSVIKGKGALVFGLSKDFEHYRVEIDDKKNLVIVKDNPSKGKVEKLFSSKEEIIIKSIGFYNKITVRKYQGSFYIYVNDLLLKQFENLVFTGDQIGYSVGLNSEISVDFLYVSYLKSKTAPILAQNKTVNKDSVKTLPKIAAVTVPVPKDTSNIAKPVEIKAAPAAPVITVAPAGPMITWVSPSGLTTSLDTYTARVRANIKSGSDLKSVLFYVNGTSKGEAELKTSQDGTKTYVAEKTLNLNPGENNVYLIATNFDGSSKSDLRYFNNPQANPPEITWGIPKTTTALVNSDAFTMEVCIKSPADLLSAQVLVNGVQVTVGKFFQRMEGVDCNYVWKPEIILKEGENSVYVIAENIAGSKRSENRIIQFSKALAEKRLALVFGNSNYANGTSLKNPINDANLMEGTLKNLGFTVIKQLNAGRDSMFSAIREFSKKLSDYNVALFYYAGHGIQVDGTNYLIPVNAKLENKEDCKWEAVAVNTVTDEFKKNSANTNIVILDACRNNPYKSWVRGGEAGFKALAPINGTIVSFSTSEGATAADGDGANGLFTEELVKQMSIAQPIEGVFKQTRKEVMAKSKGLQMPTEWTYLTGDFYFKK
jgi:hypothetical protein